MERRKASPEQLNMLLQFLEGDKELAIGRFTGLEGKMRQTNAWIKITEKLNANSGFGSGAIKTPDKWQQTWRDWKSNVKKKAFKIRKSRFTPGAGNSSQLTEAEEKILRLICGNTSVFGLSGVPETAVNSSANMNSTPSKHNGATDDMFAGDPSTSNMYDQSNLDLGMEDVGMDTNNINTADVMTANGMDGRPVWKKSRPARMVHDKLLSLEEERIRIEKHKLLEKKRCNNIRIKLERDKLEIERQRNTLLERLLAAVESMRRQ